MPDLSALTDITLETMEKRHSTRKYNTTPLSAVQLQTMRDYCASFRPYPEVRAYLITENAQQLFKFFIGYGSLSNMPAALLLVNKKHCEFELGYTGEGLILAATALGIDTCWVAASFNKKHASVLGNILLAPDEEILAVTPLGFAKKPSNPDKKRLALEEIASNINSYPDWAKKVVEAVRIAPSALNCQPWRFEYKDKEDKLVLSMETKDKSSLFWGKTKRKIDIGIATLHAKLIAQKEGKENNIEVLI